MKTCVKSQLELARAHFYSLRFVEAYHIFRRYFDRIPFKPEKEHAENVGMFVRVLSELGKCHELEFYVDKLEAWHRRLKDPAIAYSLAVMFLHLPEPRMESTRTLCDEILRNPNTETQYRIKSKMLLAHYYESKKGDIAACRTLIDSIEEPEDANLRILWFVWKAKILKDEGKMGEAEHILNEVLNTITPESDWYGYFSAKRILASLYLKRNEIDKVNTLLCEVRNLFQGKPFKLFKTHIEELERQIVEKSSYGDIEFIVGENGIECCYERRKLKLAKSSQTAKLLSLFVKSRLVDKEKIVNKLYNRRYDSLRDDKLVYYHIHSLRNKMKNLGIPPAALVLEECGYRLVPKIIECKGGEW